MSANENDEQNRQDNDEQDKQTQVRDVIVEAAKMQLASTNAAVKFWVSWAEATSKYTQNVSQELARIVDEGTTAGEVVTRFADLNREYLRELSDLPQVAATQLSDEMEKFRQKGPRTRAAKVKE